MTKGEEHEARRSNVGSDDSFWNLGVSVSDDASSEALSFCAATAASDRHLDQQAKMETFSFSIGAELSEDVPSSLRDADFAAQESWHIMGAPFVTMLNTNFGFNVV